MAKKRKTAAGKSGKAAPSQQFTRDDHITALVIAVAIVIAFVALYLYQNAKPKTALLDGGAAVTTLVPA
jgi:flagellar biosynthesis/type III secretory pathway M-ring protein FliF/YscJ